MKKSLLLFGFLILSGVAAKAAPLVAEAPISGYGTPVTVSVSSTTLTQVPSSQTVGRIGIFIDNPYTNTGHIVGFIGNCTSTALASTIRPIEIAPASNSTYFPLREDACMWLLDTNTSAASESVHYQEVKQ